MRLRCQALLPSSWDKVLKLSDLGNVRNMLFHRNLLLSPLRLQIHNAHGRPIAQGDVDTLEIDSRELRERVENLQKCLKNLTENLGQQMLLIRTCIDE